MKEERKDVGEEDDSERWGRGAWKRREWWRERSFGGQEDQMGQDTDEKTEEGDAEWLALGFLKKKFFEQSCEFGS